MREWHPFNFNPNHQKHVFDKMVYLTNPSSQREVLNCFFTSFFHAWKEYNFTGKEKFKVVFPLIGKDFLKMMVGLAASVGVVLSIHYVIVPNGL